MASRPTHHEILERSVRALGGTWDTQRAVTALRDGGYRPADQRAAEKEARRILRELGAQGLLVRTDLDRAIYQSV
ncbi:hypothetical protein [Streptomyces shenzhenensis]|uniref:hypothetical protein n=1 Tax=Streptomyces shenzhenensis TaxID=943815 RepID=UPI0015EFFBF7|nr:hypothetical protein [Streptomyces shenzhenensis]